MTRRIISVLAILVLAACASSHSTAVAPPVKVVVTTDAAVKYHVKGEKLAEVTEEALRRYAPHAAPATVTVHFESVTVAPSWAAHIDERWDPQGEQTVARPVAIISTTPWDEPVKPTASSSRPLSRSVVSPSRPVVKGTYTIADANGVVLEQKALYMSVNYGDGYSDRLDEERSTGAYLAKRVAKLAPRQQ